MNGPEINIKVTADTSQFVREMKRARRSARSLGPTARESKAHLIGGLTVLAAVAVGWLILALLDKDINPGLLGGVLVALVAEFWIERRR